MESEWGIHNWRDPAAYPQDDAESSVWAWEFLRRNPAYRTFWEEKCKPYLQEVAYLGAGGGSTIALNRNANGEHWPYHDELMDVFAVDVPSAPDEAAPPQFSSMSTRYVTGDVGDTPVSVTNMWSDRSGKAEVISRETDTQRGFKGIMLDEGDAAFIIDLSRPLRAQLDNVERIAKRLQADQGGVKARRRTDAQLYELYLRILDAEETGEKVANVKNELFADLSDDYGDSRRNRAYYESKKAAVAMRDEGYKNSSAAEQ